MLDRRTVFEIHRLADEGLSARKIAGALNLNRRSVAKYLRDAALAPKKTGTRESKLDPYKEEIDRLLGIDPGVSAVVVRQRLRAMGFDGGVTIVKDYLATIRKSRHSPRAHVRFESPPGRQCQIDWGHFGSLLYNQAARKLYCLAVIEAHSRLLYLEFTHSQKQECLHRGLVNAWRFFGGTPREVVVDNMLTAVTERVGSLIRFNEAFLEFLRPFKIVPYACHPGNPQEKGKVENVIKYVRRNFRPLRSFVDLRDANVQADDWRDRTANRRIHAATGQRPAERFRAEAMRPLPEFMPDCRETASLKVHTDFSVRFDGNDYTVPPWAVGKQVMVKADDFDLTVYYKDRPIAAHPRSFERKKRIELPAHREAAKRQMRKEWLSKDAAAFLSLGREAENYLEHLTAAGRGLKKELEKLLALKDEYGRDALIGALRRAMDHRAYGADYIENILYQETTPTRNHLPVRLTKEHLNHIRLDEPSLAEYDALVVKRRPKP